MHCVTLHYTVQYITSFDTLHYSVQYITSFDTLHYSVQSITSFDTLHYSVQYITSFDTLHYSVQYITSFDTANQGSIPPIPQPTALILELTTAHAMAWRKNLQYIKCSFLLFHG